MHCAELVLFTMIMDSNVFMEKESGLSGEFPDVLILRFGRNPSKISQLQTKMRP